MIRKNQYVLKGLLNDNIKSTFLFKMQIRGLNSSGLVLQVMSFNEPE